jgi:RNA polymerase sigma-70 factor (ECF subfamily)
VLRSQARRFGDLRTVSSFGRRGDQGSLRSQGDFEELYFAMSDRLLMFLTRRTADPETARDLWAETWARAYESRGRFRGSANAQREAWVLGIARHVLAGYYKRGKVERRALARLELEPPPISDRDLERLERRAALGFLREEMRSALAELASDQRDALQLRIVDGLPYPEVARRMGVKEPAARARVSRGLRVLAQSIDRGDVDFELGDWA